MCGRRHRDPRDQRTDQNQVICQEGQELTGCGEFNVPVQTVPFSIDVTVPDPGAVTPDQLRAAVSAPPVALEMVGGDSVPMLPLALFRRRITLAQLGVNWVLVLVGTAIGTGLV